MMQSALKYVVGVWGCGVVGESVAQLFEERGVGRVQVLRYDKYKVTLNGQVSPDVLVAQSDFIFLCLPTPMSESGEIDLSYIRDGLQMITDCLSKVQKAESSGKLVENSGKIVAIRSTVIPGSGDMFAKDYPLLNIVMLPEFLTESQPFEDTANARRVVIGTPDRLTFFVLESLFRFVYPSYDVHMIHMQRKEAEMYKYACNYLLAMTAMACNELFFMCKALGVDYPTIQKNFHYDARLGTHTIVPGPDGDYGIGGKCLPKDINALEHISRSREYDTSFTKAAIALNERVRQNKDWMSIRGAVSSCGYSPSPEGGVEGEGV